MKEKAKRERRTVKGIYGDFKNCMFLLRTVGKYTPSYLVMTFFEGIFFGIYDGFASVVFIKMLFDRLEAGRSFAELVQVIVIWAVLLTLRMGYGYGYGWYYKQAVRQRLHQRMQEDLFRKAQEIDLSCYDDPKFYNDFIWAINEADTRAAGVVEACNSLFQSVGSVLTIFGVMMSVSPVVVVFSLVFGVLSAYVGRIGEKLNVEEQEKAMPYKRKTDYVARVFTLPEYAKEMRIGHAPVLLRREYRQAMQERRKITKAYGLKQYAYFMVTDFTNGFLMNCGVYVYLTVRLFRGTITLGGFTAMTGAIFNLFWRFNSLAKTVTSFTNHGLYAEKLLTFLSYEPHISDGSELPGTIEDIVFDGVSFQYPGNAQDSLKELNFTIHRGEKVAIVGYNGAGKTTLIKLLLRLYDPTDGSIVVNGRNIKEYRCEPYREKFGTVFQDYQIFASTLAENVLADVYEEADRPRVERSLVQSTFADRLSSMPEGIMTPLTREFDEKGVNLSGGETQKVAIARIFAGDREVIVMDEPSSALDPMSEYELNQTILSYSKNKTVIFISHRLSTTRIADRILMFDQGRLIEQGSHEELMKQGGKYAQMFLLQAEKYTAKSV